MSLTIQCAINPFGQCVSASSRFTIRSKSATTTEAPGGNYFYVASNFTYCERSEATCAQCRSAWERAYPDGQFGSRADRARREPSTASLSCVGIDGCICLAYCEVPGYLADLPDTCTSTATGNLTSTQKPTSPLLQDTNADAGSGNESRVMWVEFLLGIVAVVVVLVPLVMAGRQYFRTHKTCTWIEMSVDVMAPICSRARSLDLCCSFQRFCSSRDEHQSCRHQRRNLRR